MRWLRRERGGLPAWTAMAVSLWSAATPAPAAALQAAPSEDPLTVYLVTAAPGEAIWERFGHNGIWIHDARTGEDLFWEWGLFSFRQEGFMARLARGTMLYSMGGRYLSDMLARYAADDRQVWAQELNLTPEQELALDRFVRHNAQVENRDYIYDYYTDNCSTRARDALDQVLGGRIRETFQPRPAGVSWRWHTQRLLRPVPWAEAGVQIVLGRPGDEEITAWDEMFLPLQLRRHLAELEIPGPDGASVPLVVREMELLSSPGSAVPTAPPRRWPWALLAGGLLAWGVTVLGRRARAGTGALRGLGLLTAGWSLLAGGLGAVLVVAWLFTDHDHWRWNENLLLLNPLLLGAFVPALGLAVGQAPRSVPAGLRRLLQGVAAVSLGSVLLKLLPGSQGNGDVLLLALAVNVALAAALSRVPVSRT